MKEIFKPISMGNWQNGFDNTKENAITIMRYWKRKSVFI
jgi:hypothetical protein